MPSRSRSVLVSLGAVASVILVVAGASAAAGWGSRDGVAAGAAPPEPAASSAGVPVSAVVPEPAASVPAPPGAARDPVIRSRAGAPVAQASEVLVERVDLGATSTVDVRGAARDVSAVYRVTVSAGPYAMRDLPAVLTVDDVPLGVAAESDDLQSLVLYTYDDAVTMAGATLALSYGLSAGAPVEWSMTLGDSS